jgi:maltose alpha-D-glucosyltransferase / alpha-amylase
MLQYDPYWYRNAVFYEVHTRAFYDSNGDGQGDLAGLRQKLGYLKELGVDCIWLLPIYSSPFKDGGYDISDFCNVHPDFGSLDDLKALLASAHECGIHVIMDLVLNHTSDQHRWFQSARADRNSPYRDYYVWSDTDQKYQDARIIFLDTEKSNWTWDEKAGQYFWHRFYSFQPDLNYDNLAVRAEMLGVMDFWLAMGFDGFRVDAVPYLIEREGTSCENLPETHVFLKEMRQFVDKNYPGRVLLCEANQWPKDVRAYLGEGDEFQLAFQFPMMPRIFMALRKGDYTPIKWALSQTPPIPENCQWCTFLRNHDELTLEMVTEEERQWMWQEYAPDTGMRLNLGIRRRLAPLLDNDPQKILLAYSLLFSLPGSPVIYYGDEIGMGDDISRPDRDGVRSPMQWDASGNAGFTTSATPYSALIQSEDYSPSRVNVAAAQKDPQSLWSRLHKMIAIRKSHPVLAIGQLIDIPGLPESIAAYLRICDEEKLLIVNNLCDNSQNITLPMPNETAEKVSELFSGREMKITQHQMELFLQPREYLWLKFE